MPTNIHAETRARLGVTSSIDSTMVSHSEIVKTDIKTIPKQDPITRTEMLPFRLTVTGCLVLRVISYLPTC